MSLEIALGDLFDCIETVRTSAVRQENELMRLFLLRALRDRPSELVTGDGTGEPCPPFVAKGAQRSTDETDIPEACPGPHAVAATLRTPSTDLTEVDIKGRPYDPAIHSGSRGKCQDGTWKKRKNVPPEVTAAADAAWAAKCQAPKSFGSEDGMLFDANPVPPRTPAPCDAPGPRRLVAAWCRGCSCPTTPRAASGP